jgi:hypothetical protein
LPTEIALTDGTKFRVASDAQDVLDTLGGSEPRPGWVYIAEENERGQRHFNPMHVTYVRDVVEQEALVSEIPR